MKVRNQKWMGFYMLCVVLSTRRIENFKTFGVSTSGSMRHSDSGSTDMCISKVPKHLGGWVWG
jgi:hypothetical protein